MATATYVNQNGTWRTVKKLHVNQSGTWRDCKYAYVNQNGSWKLVFRRAFFFTQTISGATVNYNLRTQLTNAGWNGTDDVEATITNNSTIYSNSTSVVAFEMRPALPAGSIVTVVNNGYIIGKGGQGGTGGGFNIPPSTSKTVPGYNTIYNATNGAAGGYAFATASTVYIPTGTARIWAGGGGGGGGRGRYGYALNEAKYGWALCQSANGGSGGSSGGGYHTTPGGSPGPTSAWGPGYFLSYLDPPAPATSTHSHIHSGPGYSGNAGGTSAGGTRPGYPRNSTIPTSASPFFGPVSITTIGGTGGAGGGRGTTSSAGASGGTGSTPVITIPGTATPESGSTNTPVGSGGSGRVACYPGPTSPYYIGPGF